MEVFFMLAQEFIWILIVYLKDSSQKSRHTLKLFWSFQSSHMIFLFFTILHYIYYKNTQSSMIKKL